MLTNLLSASVLALSLGFAPSPTDAAQPAQPQGGPKAKIGLVFSYRGFEIKPGPVGFQPLFLQVRSDDKAIMTSGSGPNEKKVEGTWSMRNTDKGPELTLRFADRVYVGLLNGFHIDGTAEYTDYYAGGGPQPNWIFTATFSPFEPRAK